MLLFFLEGDRGCRVGGVAGDGGGVKRGRGQRKTKTRSNILACLQRERR